MMRHLMFSLGSMSSKVAYINSTLTFFYTMQTSVAGTNSDGAKSAQQIDSAKVVTASTPLEMP